jgi:hypothetical protein
MHPKKVRYWAPRSVCKCERTLGFVHNPVSSGNRFWYLSGSSELTSGVVALVKGLSVVEGLGVWWQPGKQLTLKSTRGTSRDDSPKDGLRFVFTAGV